MYTCVQSAHVACVYRFRCEWILGVCADSLSSLLFGGVLQYFGPIWWDPNPATGDPNMIQTCARCGPDTQAIRRPTHGMIRRSVSVRAVKTRRRFGSETASFHVSVRSFAFPYLPLSVCVYMLHLSFHVTFCYILPVWLLVPLHEISMIVHFNYIVDRSLYQCHFMCW